MKKAIELRWGKIVEREGFDPVKRWLFSIGSGSIMLRDIEKNRKIIFMKWARYAFAIPWPYWIGEGEVIPPYLGWMYFYKTDPISKTRNSIFFEFHFWLLVIQILRIFKKK